MSETDLSDQDVTTSFAYDDVGRLVYQLNALDWGRGFTYDATDRLISVTEDIGLCTWAMCQAVTTYTYDRMGNRVALTLPDGASRAWTYDAADQMRTQTDGLGRTTSWNYTPAGQVANQIDPRGSTFTIDYQLTLRSEASGL